MSARTQTILTIIMGLFALAALQLYILTLNEHDKRPTRPPNCITVISAPGTQPEYVTPCVVR